MKKIALSILLLTSMMYGQSVTTNASITSKAAVNDAHGRRLQQQTVTISTKNYEVDTFWSRFFKPDEKTKTFTEVKTSATAQLTTEASSVCSIAGSGTLAAQGCSGQKPFLLNDASVAGLVDGGSVSLIFQPVFQDGDHPVGFYTSTAADRMIYALDIGRNVDYYKNDVALGAKKSFFSFFTEIFQTFFSFFGFTPQNTTDYLNQHVYKIDNTTYADDERQRYRANIIAGVDQTNLMSIGTDLHQNLLYTPVSLLYYKTKESDITTCQTSAWPTMCKMIRGFTSLFFNTTLLNKNTFGSPVRAEIITIDTENALLALAGKITPTKVKTTATSAPTGLFAGMFSWMSSMMNMMFGTTTAAPTTPVYSQRNYQFTDSEAMTMTIPVTRDGGRTVDRFETYKLMGLHSTDGAQGAGDETCIVEKKEPTTSFFFFPTGTSTSSETFYKSKGTTTTAWSMKLQTGTTMFFIPVYTTYNTHQLWVSWCAAKGVGGSSTDGSKTYTVKSYNNNGIGLGRGLILDLKKVTLDPGDPLNSTQFKLINVTH